jgi:hypothetical protein
MTQIAVAKTAGEIAEKNKRDEALAQAAKLEAAEAAKREALAQAQKATEGAWMALQTALADQKGITLRSENDAVLAKDYALASKMSDHLTHLAQLERQGSKLCRDVGPSIEDKQRLKDELEGLAVAATSGPRDLLRASEMDQMHVEPYNRQTDVSIAPEVKRTLTADGSSSSDELSDYGMDMLYVVRILNALSLKSFAGRWELQLIIGTGGSGVVVLAKDKQLKQDVALKAMKGAPIFGQGEQKRHEREAIAMKRVNHQCIVNFLESHYDPSKRIYFTVMEHCPGRSLEAVLASDGPLPYPKLVDVAISLVSALQGGSLCDRIYSTCFYVQRYLIFRSLVFKNQNCTRRTSSILM